MATASIFSWRGDRLDSGRSCNFPHFYRAQPAVIMLAGISADRWRSVGHARTADSPWLGSAPSTWPFR
jgi:hypothetical protein